ncbi:MAG: hypothetical protein K8S99_00190 [Planctomycetes bacterium]|nr:hypothetical protein [Planctomycetota bacterium]
MAEQFNETSSPDTRRSRATAGLMFRVAGELAPVLDAWRLVYTSYRAEEMIEPNPHRLHTLPAAVGEHSAIIVGTIGPLTVSTLTACNDGPRGLPLDTIFHTELDSLRASGGRLTEVCLFADRRRHLGRSAEAVFDLMRYSFYYGLYSGTSDFVLGVDPGHVGFFTRGMGMEQLGETRPYPPEHDRPIVLLHGNLRTTLPHVGRHPALDYFLQNPVPVEVFTRRFGFNPRETAGSDLAEYLVNSRPHAGPGAA